MPRTEKQELRHAALPALQRLRDHNHLLVADLLTCNPSPHATPTASGPVSVAWLHSTGRLCPALAPSNHALVPVEGLPPRGGGGGCNSRLRSK